MGAPQIIVVVLMALGAGLHLAKHGERKDERYNFVSDCIGSCVLLGLLYWGGFFG
jgi:hypothetical protein